MAAQGRQPQPGEGPPNAELSCAAESPTAKPSHRFAAGRSTSQRRASGVSFNELLGGALFHRLPGLYCTQFSIRSPSTLLNSLSSFVTRVKRRDLAGAAKGIFIFLNIPHIARWEKDGLALWDILVNQRISGKFEVP